MKIINPIVVTPVTLIASNVPVDDAPEWVAGSYDLGELVVFNLRVYEALTTTTDQPDEGVLADPPTWLDLGVVNRWRMFDGIIGQATTNSGTIEATVQFPQVVNAISFFGLQGNTLKVTVADSVDGIVYEREEPLQDNSAITSWYAYFFEPIIQREDLTLLDLPQYQNAEITIEIDAGLGIAECGEAVIGRQQVIGVTNFGTSVSIQDYSRKERDQFGNVTVVERRFAKLVDYDVTIETMAASSVQSILARFRARPIVYIGDENRPETVAYGFYRGWRIGLDNPAISSATIEVEGIV